MNSSMTEEQQAIVLEDDEQLASAYGKLLKTLGYHVRLAHRISQARAYIRERSPDLILVDISLPDGNGLDLMNELRNDTRGRFVVISGDESQRAAIKSIRHRAVEYLVKPVTLDQLKSVLQTADAEADGHSMPGDEPSQMVSAADSDSEAADSPLLAIQPESARHSCWINAGDCQELNNLRIAMSFAAERLRGHALIVGQPGVEKTAVARELHKRSRREGRFILVDCSAEQGSAGLARLFGKQDPVTGKVLVRGFVEQAAGGTLVLDYVEQLPMEAQSRLTGVLDSGYYKRVDAESASQSNVAVVAIARKSRTHDADETELRTEFLFRLAETTLMVPSLKQCRSAIGQIAQSLLNDTATREGRAHVFEASAIASIKKREWPGNVRELRSDISRAVACATDGEPIQIEAPRSGVDDISDGNSADQQIAPWVGKTIWELERQLLLATLAHYDGDKQLTARTLGISLKTLYNRMNALETDL